MQNQKISYNFRLASPVSPKINMVITSKRVEERDFFFFSLLFVVNIHLICNGNSFEAFLFVLEQGTAVKIKQSPSSNNAFTDSFDIIFN